MTILQISDTHNRHGLLADLPDADVIVHCGDFTDRGTEEETLDFLNWFMELPYAHKIFVVGNHDLCLWDAIGRRPAREYPLSAGYVLHDRRRNILWIGL